MHWSNSGSAYKPIPGATLIESIPSGQYNLMVDAGGLFLMKTEAMELPSRLYGDTQQRAERIMRTFNERTKSTGILLSGEKGTGKTLLAKKLAQMMVDAGYLCVNVGFPIDGTNLMSFIEMIDKPCMVFFDEFEKIFHDRNLQQTMLTVLDGSMVGAKRMWVATVNDRWGLADHFHNRPGRFFYHYGYGGMSEAAILEYASEHLKNKAEIPRLVSLAAAFATFSFDMMAAIVEEANRYDEPVAEVIKHVNAAPMMTPRVYEVLSVATSNPKYKLDNAAISRTKMQLSPFAGGGWLHIPLAEPVLDDDGEHNNTIDLLMEPGNIVEIKEDKITYRFPDVEVTLARAKEKVWTYSDFAM